MSKQSFIFVIIYVIFCLNCYECVKLQCPYEDSINITTGIKDIKSNIIYRNIVYPPNLYGVVEYEYQNFSQKVRTKPYIRGCLCQLRSCIRLCCPEGKIFVKGMGCTEATNEISITVVINATVFSHKREDLGLQMANLMDNDRFGFIYGKPCKTMFSFDPSHSSEDEWHLIENGSLWRPHLSAIYSRHQYCLLSEGNYQPVKAVGCFQDIVEMKYTLYPIGMFLSIPFLLATFFVYAIIPELRNRHGKSLMCYILGLTVGYVFLSIAQLELTKNQSASIRRIFGYIIYFSFMVSFFWLNVMCFDIWWTFKGIGVRGSKSGKYLMYSIYAWGCSILMISLVIFIDLAEFIPKDIKPEIGVVTFFIKDDKLIEFIYLYLPILVLVCVNIYFFAATAIQIRNTDRETAVITRKFDSSRHSSLSNDKDRFGLYLRLFIVMGITWSLEIISWGVSNIDFVFYISDACNCMQGLIIFLLLVCKRKVKKLFLKKFGYETRDRATSYSVRTSSSLIQRSSKMSRYSRATSVQ